MPWQPLPRIVFAVATYPFVAEAADDLPLEIGDELYIIERSTDSQWLRGYLLAPHSLLSGLTACKGQTLEARVFTGVCPRSCVELLEELGGGDDQSDEEANVEQGDREARSNGDSGTSRVTGAENKQYDASVTTCNGGSSSSSRGTSPGSNARRTPLLPLSPGSLNNSRLDKPQARLSKLSKPDPDAPRPTAPVPMLKIGDETPTSLSEPLIDEVASCLREWQSTYLHQLLLSRQYSRLDELFQIVQSLDLSRRQLVHGVLTAHECNASRERTVWEMVRGNKLCAGEIIVRDPKERGRILTGGDSVVEITRLQSIMSLLEAAPQPQVEATATYYLLVDVKSFAGSLNEGVTLVLNLVRKTRAGEAAALSESYMIDIPGGGTMLQTDRQSQMRTLFTDLTPTDVGDGASVDTDLYLVLRVQASQQVVTSVRGKSHSTSTSTSHHVSTPVSREREVPVSTITSVAKSSRRSLVWGSTRSAFSRGGSKLIPLSEQGEERPRTESREGTAPPSTANSKGPRPSSDGATSMLMADKTVGVSVVKISQAVRQDSHAEHILRVWAPAAGPDGGTDEWDGLVSQLLDKSPGHDDRWRGVGRLNVHIKSFSHPDADALIKSRPTLLSAISKTPKMGFSGTPTKPRSDIYITLNKALICKETLLSRLGASATALPSTVSGNNLTVTLEVRRQSGEGIDKCIYQSSNSEAVTTWRSCAVERGDSWEQTLRLTLQPADVLSAHLVMTVSDLPVTHPFAVAYMPLWDQQAFIRDGRHSLLMYRLDDNIVTALSGPGGKGGYLALPWGARDSSEVTGPLASLQVTTCLCNTQFSQERVILGLLGWKDQRRAELPDLLKQLIFVDEMEVVRLLKDVLDALFGILVELSGHDEHEDLVFSALVRVLGTVHDRRFNLGPVVEEYAEKRFNSPFATPCLVRSFTRLLSKPTEPETARKLRATFKVVGHILKFIKHGRGQQKAKEAGIGITGSTPGFTRHVQTIFKALDSMMRNKAPVLVGSQTLAVQYFHTWLPELGRLLTTVEILHIAIDFMDSCSAVTGKLVLYKLILIINYSRLDLFSQPEQRAALSTNTVRWIAPHWGLTDEITDQWKEQVRLCCSVLASQAAFLGPEVPDYIPKVVDSYLGILRTERRPKRCFSLLFPSSYPFPSKATAEAVLFDEALIELSAVLSALSQRPNGMQLELAEEDVDVLIDKTLTVHLSILQGEAFPSSWLSLHMFHHKSIMKTLQYFGRLLLLSFLPDPDEAPSFNTELWKLFFSTLLRLVGSGSLALETFPEQKRRAIWKIAGDVREDGAELLRRTWESIGWETSADERTRYGLSKMGGYQVQYVPSLVGPIVELCLSVHEGLRMMAVEVLQTMMVSEWTLSEHLSAIQSEMMDHLDLYFTTKPMSDSLTQQLFIGELLQRFAPLGEMDGEPLYAALLQLVGTAQDFLKLLVAVHSAEGTGLTSRLSNRLQLMEFLRGMHSAEMFVRYVHELAQLEADALNHTQAGLALRLHADLYEWNPIKMLPALNEPAFPAQSHLERREGLYFDMIKHFEDGEAWNCALAAYKELREQYENNVYDFAKLARTERAMASIYETIAKTDRLAPKYFRVVFRGLGFPSSMRDREYIYEGSAAERTAAFTDRLQEHYASAQIVTAGDVDSDSEGQFLVVSSVHPHRNTQHHVFQRAKVPQPIRDYLLSAHAQTFSITSKRVTTGPVTHHYSDKTVYTTAEPFPTILRRSEVLEVHELRLGAKETALERIVRKTQEMTAVEKRVEDGGVEYGQLLVDAISISVNPRSESSVARYRQLLPCPRRDDQQDGDQDKYQDDEDEDAHHGDVDDEELDPQETAIKMALVDHAIMIKRCMTAFSRSSNAIFVKAHQELNPDFESSFAPEIAIFTSTQARRGSLVSTRQRSPTQPSGQDQTRSRSITGSVANGTSVTEEAAAARELLVRQRGARLSVKGGKKKGSTVSNRHVSIPGHGDAAVAANRWDGAAIKDSIRGAVSPEDPVTVNSHTRQPSQRKLQERAQSTSRKSSDVLGVADKNQAIVSHGHRAVDGDSHHKAKGVRRRMSLLKLGGKKEKSKAGNGAMDGVGEV